MSPSLFSPQRILGLSCIGLGIVALVLGILSRRDFQGTTSSAQTVATSSVPAFTSASFLAGDPLLGLGPEWTFLRQEELSEKDGAWLAGTVPTRQSIVKLTNGQVQMFLAESRIQDQSVLDEALAAPPVKHITVGGRDGYLVPVGHAQDSVAFALIGQTTVLLIQDGSVANWPKNPAPEVVSYIASLHLP